MAYERTINELDVIDQPACIHLRSKGMYVTGDLDPSHYDEVTSHSHNCWCNRTQHVVGPDENSVARHECTPGRDCYCDS